MNYVLSLTLLVNGGNIMSGQTVQANKGLGVTVYSEAGKRFQELLSNSCQVNEVQRYGHCETVRPSDCTDLDKNKCPTGIYTIYPDGTSGFDVYCEMDKDGGGWTVLQRRQDGSINFFRNWATYKKGFGFLDGEFWLGNDRIHHITSQGTYTLRIDLEDFENNKRYAKYSKFSVGPESDKYTLNAIGYTGNAGNCLIEHHNASQFSTKERDNDRSRKHRAQLYKGGWWYGACHHGNLNGLHLKGEHESYANGVNWSKWKGHRYSLKTTTMMIKRF